jgi:hypothetical protein
MAEETLQLSKNTHKEQTLSTLIDKKEMIIIYCCCLVIRLLTFLTLGQLLKRHGKQLLQN